MVKQYPHILFKTVETEGYYDPETGDIVPGGSELTEIGICREELNGSGGLIALTDGSQYQFSSMVYMPKGYELKEGDNVTIKEGERIRATGQIKRFSTGQLNSKVWL